MSRHGREIAEALARHLGPIAPQPPDDPSAALAAFTVPQQAEGIPVKINMPINELLTNFVMAHSGLQKETGTGCDQCGETLDRQPNLLKILP